MNTPTPGPSGSAARAVAVTTGHPALKLVLLTVAALPGWPTVGDIAAAAELSPTWTADALAELDRLRMVYRTGDPPRYAIPDEGGWGYTGPRDGDDRPDVEVPPVPRYVDGYRIGHHGAQR